MLTTILIAAALLMTSAATVQGADADRLVGSWRCRTAEGVVPLEFPSRNRLIFNGDAASYKLAPGAIRVQEDNGPVNYRYRFKGDTLLITFPQGVQISCTKAKASSAPGVAEPKAADKGGQEHLLKGRLCSWSGSRSGTSSYSSTRWALFDGRGRFTYGSEGSFSSDAGIAAGSRPASSGTYRVSGNAISFSFQDGGTGVATVHYRQANGTITELMYEGQLYGAALCE
jgi:hypothetical protein